MCNFFVFLNADFFRYIETLPFFLSSVYFGCEIIAGLSGREVISLQKVDSLIALGDIREAKKVFTNSRRSGFEACILNRMGLKLNDNNKMNP